MEVNETIALICNMPSEFTSRGNISIKELFEKSGYQQNYFEITEINIEEYLTENKHLVETWRRFSEDQRCIPTYYFIQNEEKWIVGYYPNGDELEFTESIKACAYYIKNILIECILLNNLRFKF